MRVQPHINAQTSRLNKSTKLRNVSRINTNKRNGDETMDIKETTKTIHSI